MISNLIPRRSTDYISDHHVGNSEFYSKRGFAYVSSGKQFANEPDLICLKFRSPDIFSTYCNPPALGSRVQIVVSVSPQEQMIGPNTIWNITSMQDVCPGRNVSELKHPRQSMGYDVSIHDTNHSVSKSVSRSMPQPATVIFLDFSPKSICNGSIPICPDSDFFSGHSEKIPIPRLYNNMHFGSLT